MTLTRKQASTALPEWRYLLGRMHFTVDAGSFPAAAAFVNEVARIAEEQDHHPEIDWRFARVHLAVASHDVGGITRRDVDFGRAISRIAIERGLSPQPDLETEVEIAIDALDIDAVLPFWRAVTGYEAAEQDELRDPDRIRPTIWFQQMDEPREQRSRIHVDVSVPHDCAQARVDAALAAGGRLVDGGKAPSFWVLADPEGNEACVCTWQGRSDWFTADAG